MTQELPLKKEFEDINKYREEMVRIQKILEGFLDKERAYKVTEKIYVIAVEIDKNIGALLEDPEVLKKYDYDGEFFKPKSGYDFFKAFSGLSFLKNAASNQNIETLLSSYKIKGRILQGVEQMLDWFWGNYVWLAKARLQNWKQRGDIGLISRDVLEEAIEDARLREIAKKSEEVQPLSPGEKDFFSLYEEEMGLSEGELDEWLRKKMGSNFVKK